MNKKEIVVNGVKHVLEEDSVSYEQLVYLAYGSFNPEVVYTVLYYAGKSDHVKGSLVLGENKEIHTGMIFNVTITSQS